MSNVSVDRTVKSQFSISNDNGAFISVVEHENDQFNFTFTEKKERSAISRCTMTRNELNTFLSWIKDFDKFVNQDDQKPQTYTREAIGSSYIEEAANV